MFLDYLGTQGHSGSRYRTSHGMVGQSHHTVKYFLHGRNGLQIDILVRGRISGRTLQQDHVLIAFFLTGAQCQFDIRQISNSRGHDDRFAGACDLTYKRNIVDLKRGHLIYRHIHLLQEINAGQIKRRGEKDQSHLLCDFFQFGLPLPGRIGRLV